MYLIDMVNGQGIFDADIVLGVLCTGIYESLLLLGFYIITMYQISLLLERERLRH